MILTDDSGRVFERPQREDYATAWEFVRAVHEHNQRITNEANRAFEQGLVVRTRPRR